MDFRIHLAIALLAAHLSCMPSPVENDAALKTEEQDAVRGFDAKIKKLWNVNVEYDSQNLARTTNMLEEELRSLELNKRLIISFGAALPELKEKDAQLYRDTLAAPLRRCKEALTDAQDHFSRESCHIDAIRNYYAISADLYELHTEITDITEANGLGRFVSRGRTAAQRAQNFSRAIAPGGYPVPTGNKGQVFRKRFFYFGSVNPKKEAHNLYDSDQNRFFETSEFVGKTVDQVSRIDIPPNHPTWYRVDQLNQLRQQHGTVWRLIENRAQAAVSNLVSTRYNMHDARRVLFFDEIKTTATSPKMDTKDAFGIKWKLKWGDEIQTEVAGNRLWTHLGGRWTDLVYANGPGRAGVTLLLAKPTEKPKQSDLDECEALTDKKARAACLAQVNCSVTKTLDQLKNCFLNVSTYNFNIDPYLVDAGVITEQNINAVLPIGFFQQGGRAKPRDVLGRTFVTFKESIVEFKPPSEVFARVGPVSKSQLNSPKDRVARGLLLFNIWIGNRDAKDDNDRLVLDRTSGRYYEFQHDLGFAFGGVIDAGRLNWMFIGEQFLSKSGKFRFQPFLYFPTPWSTATFADMLWMGRKIVKTRTEDIATIIARTNWPVFMQQAWVYKLVARRNQIARVMGLVNESVEPVPERDMFDEFLATNRGLPNFDFNPTDTPIPKDVGGIGELLRRLIPHPIPNKIADRIVADVMEEGTRNQRDVLISANGQISKCDETVWIGIIERHLHPSGLENRISRRADNITAEQRRCSLGKPPDEHMIDARFLSPVVNRTFKRVRAAVAAQVERSFGVP